MGFFDRFKKNKPQDIEPQAAAIEKTPSLIAAIPLSSPLPESSDEIIERVGAIPFIKVISQNVKDNGNVEFIVQHIGNSKENIAEPAADNGGNEDKYNEEYEEYNFTVGCAGFQLPQLFRLYHKLTDKEIEAIDKAKRALYFKMTFGSDNSRSFHLQIKLINAIIGDLAGIADVSGERILAGRWVRLAAASDVPPAPSYLYCIQAVNSDKGGVWIHTHGLNRCGSIELEMLNSDKDNFNAHATVIKTLADNVISGRPLPDEYEPQYVIRLPGGEAMVTTWVRWQTAVKMFPRRICGDMRDRADNHNSDSGVVFVYLSEEDCQARKLSGINAFTDRLQDNPIRMITTKETQRMKALALERLDYLKRVFAEREKYEKLAALVKIGLEVDEEFREGDMKEHIWFEVKEFDEDGSFLAELTQKPYYVKALRPGDMRRCKPDEITDWLIFIDDYEVTPDSVYILEE